MSSCEWCEGLMGHKCPFCQQKLYVSMDGAVPDWGWGGESGLGKVVFLDIDGVLADTRHREHFIEEEPKDWVSFFNSQIGDGVHVEGLLLYHALVGWGATIVYLTGRNENTRDVTTGWLQARGFSLEWDLVMRPAGFKMPLAHWKHEVLRMAAGKSHEAFVDPWWKSGFLLGGAKTIDGEFVRATDSDIVIVDDDSKVIETAITGGYAAIQAGWQPKNPRLINTSMG